MLRPYPKVLDLKELRQTLSFDKGSFFWKGGVGRSRAGAEKSNSAGIGILFILLAKCTEVSRKRLMEDEINPDLKQEISK